MGRAVAKVTAHKKGGAANSRYIGSLREEPTREPTQGLVERSAVSANQARHLAEERDYTARAEPVTGRDGDCAPVWGWNVPWFVAGEAHGIWETEAGRALLESHSLSSLIQHLGLGSPPQPAEQMPLDEQRENLVAYFSTLADLEERQGGVSHYRLILSIGSEVTNHELKVMANAFLRENFPLCSAFVAVHRDTEHVHAHVYVHARQLDDKRVDLKQDYFRLDENWMRVCAERSGDREIYERHMELKAITLAWKEQAKEAKRVGEPAPPKPDRWSDHQDTRLSFRPWNDHWCGRLVAQVRVAEAKVEYLTVTQATKNETAAATRAARGMRARFVAAAEKRRTEGKSASKRQMPTEVITVSEARSLALYDRAVQAKSRGIGPESTMPTGHKPENYLEQHVPAQAVFSLADVPRLPMPNSDSLGAPHVSGLSRDRLKVEISRPVIRPHKEEESTPKRSDETEALVERTRRTKVQPQGYPSTQEEQPSCDLSSADAAHAQTSAPPQQLPPPDTATSRPAVPLNPLPEPEAWQLAVRLELARAHVLALRVEEHDFNAMPHRWLAPMQNTYLAQVERQISKSSSPGQNVDNLLALKERVQSELAGERGRLLADRQAAEVKAEVLSEQLRQEQTVRASLNLQPPTGRFTPAELQELTGYAETARDPELLLRVYKLERAQALSDARQTGDSLIMRRLEEKYAGLELKAEVSLDRSQDSLAYARKQPDKIMVPMVDKAGRTISLCLEQVQPQRGIRGLFQKGPERREEQQSRAQLITQRDAYFRYLQTDTERRRAYLAAARLITAESHARRQALGFSKPPTPALSRKELQEISDYAGKQNTAVSTRWQIACVQAERLLALNEGSTRAAKQAQERLPTQQSERARSWQSEAFERRLLSRERSVTPAKPGPDKPSPARPGSSGGRRGR